eukprot:gene12786-17143_t
MLLRIVLFLKYLYLVISDCKMLNYCNGHGTCVNSTSSCSCYDGWGADSDISFYKAPDCSMRSCPSGKAWADIPTNYNTAHALAECSNRGTCDRSTGTCKCFNGFTGVSCQRNKCPNDCSGHGICLSMKQLARTANALPLGPNTYYEGDEDSTTWDEDKLFGCVCDSSWTVGLGNGETQEPEWFGPDCSLRHCPSADNPRTYKDETDCWNITAQGSRYAGEEGNLCHVDCANQGICDYNSGRCKCFNGQYGENCANIDPRLVYSDWNRQSEVSIEID